MRSLWASERTHRRHPGSGSVQAPASPAPQLPCSPTHTPASTWSRMSSRPSAGARLPCTTPCTAPQPFRTLTVSVCTSPRSSLTALVAADSSCCSCCTRALRSAKSSCVMRSSACGGGKGRGTLVEPRGCSLSGGGMVLRQRRPGRVLLRGLRVSKCENQGIRFMASPQQPPGVMRSSACIETARYCRERPGGVGLGMQRRDEGARSASLAAE